MARRRMRVSVVPARLSVGAALVPVSGVALLLALLFSAAVPLRQKVLPLSLPPVDVKVVEAPAGVVGGDQKPSAAAPPPAPAASKQVLLRVDAQNVWLNGAPLTDKELGESLKGLLQQQGTSVVFLDAAPTLRYERVVYLLDIVRDAGATAVGLTPELTSLIPASTATAPGVPAAQTSPVPTAQEVAR